MRDQPWYMTAVMAADKRAVAILTAYRNNEQPAIDYVQTVVNLTGCSVGVALEQIGLIAMGE